MNRVKEVERINAKDLATQLSATTRGDAGTWDVSKSWHAAYSDSAYVYVGGLPQGLSEGDVSTVMAQWGEIVDVNMPRDKVSRSRPVSGCLVGTPFTVAHVLRRLPGSPRASPSSAMRTSALPSWRWTTSMAPNCSAGRCARSYRTP
jgi:hypothetical protein